MAEVQQYLDLVESQYSSKPKFMGILRRYLEDVDVSREVADALPKAFSVATATGDQLDIIGALVGVSRDYPYIANLQDIPKKMDDETYRLIINARIMQNSWDGTYGSFQSTWNSIFDEMGIRAQYYDNQDMSCSVTVSGNFTAAQAALITNGYIFPKTMGVKVNYLDDPRISTVGTANIGAAFAANRAHITVTAK